MENELGVKDTPEMGQIYSQVEVVAYLKQVYLLLAASLLISVAAGYVGMTSEFAFKHPFILMFMQIGAIILAFMVKKPVTLFIFTGLSGFATGPLIYMYVAAGMTHIVGQAVFMTAAAFGGLTFYAFTAKRDLSGLGSMLFAGLVVVLVASIASIFIKSSIFTVSIAGVSALVFCGYIMYETQMLRLHPWQEAPSVAALSMYLNIIILFKDLLIILGVLNDE